MYESSLKNLYCDVSNRHLSAYLPGLGLPISLLERRANKKTCEKGLNLKPRNARVHAFRGNFSSGYPRDKGLCLT